MTLVRYNPMRQFGPFQRHWNHMMSDILNRDFDDENLVQRVWVPRVDITEDENSYNVHADLPGMDKADIQIMLEDGVLTITGDRKNEVEDQNGNCHVSERIYGKFSRSFTMRNSIDNGKIDASFKDGVLTVELPKMEEAKPRKIEIKAH